MNQRILNWKVCFLFESIRIIYVFYYFLFCMTFWRFGWPWEEGIWSRSIQTTRCSFFERPFSKINYFRKPKYKQYWRDRYWGEDHELLFVCEGNGVWRRVILVTLCHYQALNFENRSLDYQSGGSHRHCGETELWRHVSRPFLGMSSRPSLSS